MELAWYIIMAVKVFTFMDIIYNSIYIYIWFVEIMDIPGISLKGKFSKFFGTLGSELKIPKNFKTLPHIYIYLLGRMQKAMLQSKNGIFYIGCLRGSTRGKMRVQFRAPLKPLGTILPWWTEQAINWGPPSNLSVPYCRDGRGRPLIEPHDAERR